MLETRDYFGSRLLFSARQWLLHVQGKCETMSASTDLEDRSSTRAIVADTAAVRVWIIRREMLEYLQRPVRKDLCSRVRHFDDDDRPIALAPVPDANSATDRGTTSDLPPSAELRKRLRLLRNK